MIFSTCRGKVPRDEWASDGLGRHLEEVITGAMDDDPGADYFNRLHPDRTKQRAIAQLQALGYNVTLDRAS